MQDININMTAEAIDDIIAFLLTERGYDSVSFTCVTQYNWNDTPSFTFDCRDDFQEEIPYEKRCSHGGIILQAASYTELYVAATAVPSRGFRELSVLAAQTNSLTDVKQFKSAFGKQFAEDLLERNKAMKNLIQDKSSQLHRDADLNDEVPF